MKKILFLIIFFLFLCVNLSADTGTTSAAFLKIGVGARNLSMGAVGATEKDIDAIYYNPAGISYLKEKEVSLMHLKWFGDINYEYAAFAFPYKNWGFGISYHVLSMDKIEKYDINDVKLNETYSPSDSMGTVSAAYCIEEKISFGLSLKYVNSKIETAYASTIAGDAGVIYSGLENFDFGFSVQNFGGRLKYVQTQEDLPLNFKAGVGYHGDNEKNIIPKVYVDLNQGIENKLYFSAGTECDFLFKPGWGGSLRAGYRSRDTNYSVSGFSAGAGFLFNGNTKIDFAWVPYGDLGDTYSVSFIFLLTNTLSNPYKKEYSER